MALPVILRNITRFPVPLSRNLLASASVNNTRNFSQLLNKFNSKTNDSTSKLLVAIPQMTERNFSVSEKRMSGDHSKLWTIEKALSVGLLFAVPTSIIMPNPILDNVLAVTVVAHMHLGLEACVVDYIRPIIFGSIIPKLSLFLLYVISAATLAGLIQYNMNDIGIGKTFRKLWEIKE